MNILFVCTGNTCRSPMAEGIMKHLAKKRNLDISVNSAGIFALEGGNAAINAIDSLKDLDIDISNFKSSMISRDLIEEADLVLTMSKGHKENLVLSFPDYKEKIFLLNEYAFKEEEDIEDPFGGSKDDYDRARDEIYKAIEAVILII